MNEHLRYLSQEMRYREYREQAAKDRLACQAKASRPMRNGLISRLLARLGREAIALGHELEALGAQLQQRPLERHAGSPSLARHAR